MAQLPPTHAANFAEFLWIWNRRLSQKTPALHLRMAHWLMRCLAGGQTRLLLMAFRGAGKSTVVGLYCAWLLYRNPQIRILVLSAQGQLAMRMVAAVRRIIERHPLCTHLLPERGDAWAADRFSVQRSGAVREPSMLAQGILGNFTGCRADVIVCDDVEVPNTSGTPAKRAALRERLSETEFVLTPGGTLLYVGTPHTAESLYLKTGDAFLRGYARLEIPLLDATGASAWPERFNAQTIAKLHRRVGPRRFASQMQLQPVELEAARLDPALIVPYRDALDLRTANGAASLFLGERRLLSGSAWWDPAFGKPGQGDHSVLVVVFADADGNRFLHCVSYLTTDSTDAHDPATQQCRLVAQTAGDLFVPVVHVETNGIGRFLPDLLRSTASKMGIPFAVREAVSTQRKADRILGAFDPVLAARRLYAHTSVFESDFPAEMRAWKPGAVSVKDDALDAVAGALLAEPARLPRYPPRITRPGWRGR